jgi:hypothetical protein
VIGAGGPDATSGGEAALLELSPQGPERADDTLPVRGLCVGAPAPDRVDDFARFLGEDLGPAGGNTLVLRVDFNYEYERHPELRGPAALSRAQVQKLVAAARKSGIQISDRWRRLTPGRRPDLKYALSGRDPGSGGSPLLRRTSVSPSSSGGSRQPCP